jgi:probable addiction module antidote protein
MARVARKKKTTVFDPAKYLASEESQVELLSDALQSGDLEYIKNAIGIVARARGMTRIARSAGVTREALYKATSKSGDPKLSTLLGVTKALGVTLSASAS